MDKYKTRNVFLTAYLQCMDHFPTTKKGKDGYFSFVFDKTEELLEHKNDFYNDMFLQTFIGTLVTLRKDIYDSRYSDRRPKMINGWIPSDGPAQGEKGK